MTVLNLFLIINIPIRLYETKLYIFNSSVIFWLYAFSVILMTFLMYYWFLFMLKLFNSRIVDTKIKIHITLLPALLIIPVCIINRWTGWLYYIKDDTYYRGSVFVLQALIAYVYLFLNLICIIRSLFSKKNQKIAFISLYSMVPALTGIVLQIIFGGSFLLAGTTIGASIMYIDICLDKQKSSEMKEMKEMFTQTAETLASAIDVKDEYTHGHSIRVAQYSRKIAEMAGLSEEDCERVYFSGLLHDVGKIGIPDWIINKQDRLTEEEFAVIKQHPMKGRDILAHIRKLPYLTMGAKYHHERYDGQGYPEGLKATDIPEIARIIAVADSYDAMTSNRSYRKPLSKEIVRQEILNGAGKQFDPVFANFMVQLIDQDVHYKMKQNDTSNELYCMDFRKNFYPGIGISSYETVIEFHSEKIINEPDNIPTFVIFDAVDTRVHIEEQEKKFYLYTDYCDIRIDGKVDSHSIRTIKINEKESKLKNDSSDYLLNVKVTAVKQRDHIMLKIDNGYKEITAIIVLPDSSRYAYIGITGKQCYITDITVKQKNEIPPDFVIERIAEEIKYFNKPDGDIPNIQIDSWRTSSTAGIALEKELKLSFHMRSLPFARLIWHCPFVVLFDSDNGLVCGNNYREFAFVRFDGESWQQDAKSTNSLIIKKTSDYKDWNTWKKENKEGRNIEISFKREGHQIFMSTVCGGLILENTTTIEGDFNKVFVSLTGDQVILESIKIL